MVLHNFMVILQLFHFCRNDSERWRSWYTWVEENNAILSCHTSAAFIQLLLSIAHIRKCTMRTPKKLPHAHAKSWCLILKSMYCTFVPAGIITQSLPHTDWKAHNRFNAYHKMHVHHCRSLMHIRKSGTKQINSMASKSAPNWALRLGELVMLLYVDCLQSWCVYSNYKITSKCQEKHRLKFSQSICITSLLTICFSSYVQYVVIYCWGRFVPAGTICCAQHKVYPTRVTATQKPALTSVLEPMLAMFSASAWLEQPLWKSPWANFGAVWARGIWKWRWPSMAWT